MEIADRTEEASQFERNNSNKSILSTVVNHPYRDLSRIDAIMLHQTGFDRGNDPASYDMVIAHYMVLRNGVITQIRPLNTILNDARGSRTVHIECVGAYPGPDTEVDLSAADPTPTPTLAQIRATRWLLRHICENEGLSISYILAHRQWNRFGRPADPGPHIWYNVAVWAKAALGLSSDPPGQEAGDIPASWESARFDIDPRSFGNREGWTAVLQPGTRAIGVKCHGGGVIGIYATEGDAAEELCCDRPWRKPTTWEAWIRRPSAAREAEIMEGGIVGFYDDRRAADREAAEGANMVRFRAAAR